MIPADERRLLQRIRRDPSAFGEIFDAHYAGIFAYALRRTGDFDAAKDIAAETFLKAYQGIGRFRWRGVPLAAWLFRIATNEIHIFFRSARYESTAMTRLAADPELSRGVSAALAEDRNRLSDELARHREYLLMRRQMEALPAPYQDVLALRYFEGKTVQEIADILGSKEGTVKSLISRGKERLRELCELSGEARSERLASEGTSR